MHGKFKLDEKTGPIVGKVKLTVSYSAADVPGLETADGTVTTKEQLQTLLGLLEKAELVALDTETTSLDPLMARLVGLSVSFPQQLRVVKDVIGGLLERLGTARPAVIVGGLAINRFNQLADAVGADASSTDAQAAVDSAQRIMVKQDG